MTPRKSVTRNARLSRSASRRHSRLSQSSYVECDGYPLRRSLLPEYSEDAKSDYSEENDYGEGPAPLHLQTTLRPLRGQMHTSQIVSIPPKGLEALQSFHSTDSQLSSAAIDSRSTHESPATVIHEWREDREALRTDRERRYDVAKSGELKRPSPELGRTWSWERGVDEVTVRTYEEVEEFPRRPLAAEIVRRRAKVIERDVPETERATEMKRFADQELSFRLVHEYYMGEDQTPDEFFDELDEWEDLPECEGGPKPLPRASTNARAKLM